MALVDSHAMKHGGGQRQENAAGGGGKNASALTDASPIEQTRALLHIHLHPSSLLDVHLGVEEHINSLLLRYNESLDGIPVAYSDVKRLSKTGAVSPYFPLCHVPVSVSMTLLRPRPGMLLVGKVTEMSDTFIGLLAFDYLNCVIQIGSVRSDLTYSVFGQCWKSASHKEHSITVGDRVRFLVERVDKHGGGYVTIVGSLPAGVGGTGNVEFVKKYGGAVVGSKKRRSSDVVDSVVPEKRLKGEKKKKKEKKKEKKEKKEKKKRRNP